MNRRWKSILIIMLVVLMLVAITGVAVAGRLKTGNGRNTQSWDYCGTWAAREPFYPPAHNIGNGMCSW